jgi:hypothetical protein
MVGVVWLEISWWCWHWEDSDGGKGGWKKINGTKYEATRQIGTNLCASM